MSQEQKPISPKLEALRQSLEARDGSALEAFWQQIAQQDTPIIEPLEDSSTESLVTFVWRGSEVDEAVGVVSELSEGDGPDDMVQLRGTDLWYKSYRAHNETRDSYQFAVAGRHVIDPLNSRRHIFPDDEEVGFTGWVSSVFEMPEAPPQPWSTDRPSVPNGQTNLHRIRSETLDKTYRVWVYTPPGYSTDGEAYSYLLIFDGWFYLELVPTPTILDNLLADGLAPPLVAIMVGHPFNDTRQRDLGCYPPFAEFLTKELLPWARANYHLSNDPARAAVAGGSRGGLMAAYMGLRHSEIFGRVISLSGFFGWSPEGEQEEEWLIRQYVAAPRQPLSFYLDVGSLETDMDPGDLTCMLSNNRHMRDVLQAKGYPLHYAEYRGGHNPMNWYRTMADAVLAVLGNVAKA